MMMRYLIDAQILIWSIITPEKLSPLVTNILQSNEIVVSQIAFFEIAIKQKIGKLQEFDLSIESLHYRVEQDGFYVLPLKINHITAYSAIPLIPEHRDPFDRILLATALSEQYPIISNDANFKLYSSQVQVVMNS
jgi:PIN domain nuclease of toxin-antitoxin system